MKVKKERSLFALEMKSELDILNYGGHDYLLSASALPLEEQLFQPHFSILGKTTISLFAGSHDCKSLLKGFVTQSLQLHSTIDYAVRP